MRHLRSNGAGGHSGPPRFDADRSERAPATDPDVRIPLSHREAGARHMTANYPTKVLVCRRDRRGTRRRAARPPTARPRHRAVAGDGQAVAFDDRCAHRGFPLSHGHVDGDRLVCGYHGCTYTADGRCVHVPTQPDVPSGMSVRAFPILEQGPFIWIWLGPPAAAVTSRPPRTPWLNDSGWSTFADSWRVQANYLMVHEHYLDFSYAPVFHRADVPPGMERCRRSTKSRSPRPRSPTPDCFRAAPLAEWEADGHRLDAAGSYTRRESGTFASPAMHVQRWELEVRQDSTRTSAHMRSRPRQRRRHTFSCTRRTTTPRTTRS